jgi:hypothetical protein
MLLIRKTEDEFAIRHGKKPLPKAPTLENKGIHCHTTEKII